MAQSSAISSQWPTLTRPSLTVHLFFLLRQARPGQTFLSAGCFMAEEMLSFLAPTHGTLGTTPVPVPVYLTCSLGRSCLPHPSACTPAGWPTQLPFLPPNPCRHHLSSSSSFPSTFLGQKLTHSSNTTISNTPSLKHLLPVLNCK